MSADYGESWLDRISDTLGWNIDRPPRSGPSGCQCGCGGERSAPEPDDSEWTDYGDQPAAVVLARMMPQRDADPLTRYERGRDDTAARYAEPETRGADVLSTPPRTNPDGSRLSGSVLKDWLNKHKPDDERVVTFTHRTAP